MNASQTIRSGGFSALLSVSGETIKYGNGQMVGIINRNVKERDIPADMRDGKFDFKLGGMTIIEIAFGTYQPKAGDTFYDDVSMRHRVSRVTATDITWICFCQFSSTGNR